MTDKATNRRMTPEERYQYDPVFHALVVWLRESLRHGNFTPTELREAVILAATIHEAETLRAVFIPAGAGIFATCPACGRSGSWENVNGTPQCQNCGTFATGVR